MVPIGSTSSRRSRTLDRSWENDLGQMLKNAEVVAIETRGISRDQLQPHYGPHIVLDLVNLESARRLAAPDYEGICW